MYGSTKRIYGRMRRCLAASEEFMEGRRCMAVTRRTDGRWEDV
jgi:hypothetical protein